MPQRVTSRQQWTSLELVSGQWSVVSGQWSLVTGQWSLVSGHLSVVSGQWSVVSGHWSVVSQAWLVSCWSGLSGRQSVIVVVACTRSVVPCTNSTCENSTRSSRRRLASHCHQFLITRLRRLSHSSSEITCRVYA